MVRPLRLPGNVYFIASKVGMTHTFVNKNVIMKSNPEASLEEFLKNNLVIGQYNSYGDYFCT